MHHVDEQAIGWIAWGCVECRSTVDQPKTEPIVVCGPARGGTTAVRALLNSHRDVFLANEFPLGRLGSLKDFCQEAADFTRHEWEHRRLELIRGVWSAVAGSRSTARRWGMKTPWAELDSDFYDALVEPLYVYALRRGDRVFASTMSIGWNAGQSSPRRLLGRYKESIRRADALAARGKACIVQLDLATDRDSRLRLASDVFAFVGEAIDSGVEDFIERWPTHWSRPSASGHVELPKEWQEALAGDPEYRELMASHGYEPSASAT